VPKLEQWMREMERRVQAPVIADNPNLHSVRRASADNIVGLADVIALILASKGVYKYNATPVADTIRWGAWVYRNP